MFCTHSFIFTLIASIIAHPVAAHLASASASGCYIRQGVQNRTSRMRLPAAFGDCEKQREYFFVLAQSITSKLHISVPICVCQVRLLSEIQLNQTSQNGIFVILPRLSHCISWEIRSSDILTLPHSSTKSSNLNHSLIKHEKTV